MYCLSSGLRLLFTSLVSLGQCIACPLVYDFCLPLWYLLVIVLSVLWFMTSVYLFGISWSLYCMFSDIRLLFTSLVSLAVCIVCPLICDFCLPLWYLLVIVLSVLWYTTSVYLFCISRSLYCLSSDLRVLFTSLVSIGHCIVCPLVYDFCLPLWYLLVFVLSVLSYATSVYLFGISWSLYCLSSDIRLLFTSLVSIGHCIVCPLVYDFCLPLWYLLVIVLSVLWFTTSVYLFGISWSLYCLSSNLRLLFTSLVSLGHCIVCPLVYDFCLPLWYLLVIVLSVLWFMTSVYLFDISWSLNCLSSGLRLLFISWSLYCLSSGLRLLFTSLVSLGHCIACPLIYDFCLSLWYLLVIVLSVLWFMTSVYLFVIVLSVLWFMTSVYPLVIVLSCPLFYDFCLPLWYLLVIVLSVLWFTTSFYLFGISWSLYCLSSGLWHLFTSLVSLGHCIVFPLIYDFCLPLWFLLLFVLSVLSYTTSVYLFGISWSLYDMSSDIRLQFTSLVFLCHCIVCPLIDEFCLSLCYLLVIVLSVLWFMTSVYLFGISWSLYCLSSDLRLLFTSLVSLGHCIVCPLIYDFCLPLWYLLVIELSVLWFTTSVYLFVISWSLYCLSSDLWLLFISLVSLGHCIVLSSGLRLLFTSLVSLDQCIVCPLVYDFCLPLWYLLVILLSVLWFVTFVYLFGISWSLYCMSSDIRLLFTSLVSLAICIVCPLIYDFCLPLWYLLVIVLSVLWFMTSVYLFDISWSLYCLSSDLRLLFTSSVSPGHCIVCPLIYDFCLPLWYLLVIVLPVLWFTTSVYLFGISWSLYCLSSDIRLLFTSLVSIGHCIVCPLVYDFCLPLWYLLVIVLSVLWFTTSVYLFGISWSLYCLSSNLRLLFTSLVSLGHCIVCPLVYDFCLPLWYLLVIVLSVLWFMTSVYLFDISWSLNCLSSGLRLLFISWSLYCLSSGLRLLFTSLVSLGHCIACPLIYDFCLSLWYLLVIVLSVLWFMTSVYLFVIVLSVLWFMTSVYPLVIVLSCPLFYDFCLPLWYLLVIVLSVLWFTTSFYLFGISWSLYCLSSGLWHLFTSLVSLGHCIVFPLIYDFCLPLWFLLLFVLSVLSYTTSVYLFGISWSLYDMSSDIRLQFTSLVFLCHCIVCPLIDEFCLSLCYLLVIVLSVLWFMTSVYLFGISWSLYCLSSDLRLLFTSLVSLGHCIVCPLIYDFCLPLWYLLVIELSVLWFTTSVYLFVISWSLYCLSSDLWLLFISLVSLGHCIVLSSGLRLLFTSLVSLDQCIVCPLVYDFCLPLWYLLVIVLSVLWFVTFVYLFGISWSLYCMSSDIRLLFTSLVSLAICIVCPLIYDFCLPLWYLLVIVLSVLWFMTSVYLFDISWSLYCLSSDLRLLFTSSVSPGHCIVCPLIYDFCLPLWYLLVIVLPVLWFTTSVYLFGISWSLYCLSSDLRVRFTSLVSLGHCIVYPLIYHFCLPLWYLLVIVLSVLWCTTSVYLFGISWSLYCMSSDIRLLFTSLVSLGHCIVCPLVYDFCLPLWYLLVIELSVLWFTTSVYLFVISWSLYCLSSDLWLLFTSLVSLCHWIVCPLVYDFCLSLDHCIACPLIYDFCLPLWYLLVIVLSVLWITSSVYLFGIPWSLYCLSSDLRLLFTSSVSPGHCIVCPLIYDFCLPLWYLLVIVLPVLWFTTSVYLFGISWSLYCLSSDLRVRFTSLVSLGHCIVYPLIYHFCLPLWYLLVIVLSVLWCTTSVYLFGISWSLYCMSSDIRLLFTSLVSLGHCIVCPLVYDFCLPLWYLLVIELSVLWFTTSVYLFVISWSLYCLSSGLWLLFTSLVSPGHCIVCPLVYDFCLPLWYLLVIVLSVLWFMTSVYLFGISLSLNCLSSGLRLLFTSWSLYCLSSDLRLLFTSLVSLSHCIVCPLNYEFCLPLWYPLVIVLSILWFITSVYLFGISWSLYCLSSCLPLWYFLVIVLSVLWSATSVYLFGISWSLYCMSSDIRLLFTSLVSLGHCIVCPLVYDFCLPLWYLLVIVLSVLWFTTSVYLFGISWSLYCLSSGLWLLFTSLVSLGHCIVCPLVYDFCLPLWYLLVIVLSVLWFMTSVYLFGISWSLYCLSSDLWLLFTSLVSLGHWIVCPLVYDFCLSLGHCSVCPLVYDFCLPLWYLLVIVLSVLWLKASVYLFGISWSLYYLSSDIRLLFTSLVSLGHCIVCPLIYDFCLPLWYL